MSPITVHELTEEGLKTLDLPPDRLGRKDPRILMSGLPGVAMMASWGVRVRKVPAAFWSLDGNAAVVSCPCGGSPQPVALEPVVDCECGRFFFFDGQDVWAFATPSTESDPEEEISPEES
jgi:hypothetical protein